MLKKIEILRNTSSSSNPNLLVVKNNYVVTQRIVGTLIVVVSFQYAHCFIQPVELVKLVKLAFQSKQTLVRSTRLALWRTARV
jgi:hypothetical protein